MNILDDEEGDSDDVVSTVDVHLEENERPQKCPQINTSLCAVLYDRFDGAP